MSNSPKVHRAARMFHNDQYDLSLTSQFLPVRHQLFVSKAKVCQGKLQRLEL